MKRLLLNHAATVKQKMSPYADFVYLMPCTRRRCRMPIFRLLMLRRLLLCGWPIFHVHILKADASLRRCTFVDSSMRWLHA